MKTQLLHSLRERAKTMSEEMRLRYRVNIPQSQIVHSLLTFKN